MKYTPDTTRRDVTIAGATFQVPAPFAEGHVLSAGEASALNQVLSENVRNNLAKDFKDSLAAGKTAAELQAKVDEYVTEYEFGVRGTRGPVDPVMTEARKIASAALADHFKKNGKSFSKTESDERDRLIAAVIEKNPSVMEEAKRIVKARKKALERSLDI